MKCKTCDLTHTESKKEHNANKGPFDIGECLINALGDIGQMQSRIRELKRDKAELYTEIDDLEVQQKELRDHIKTLTREID